MGNNPMIILAMTGIVCINLLKFMKVSNSDLAFLGTVVSIAFFNFAGVSVTKELSATTRMVLDSVRTLVIWTVSLSLRWQNFYWPQVSFIFLLSS